MLLVLFSLPALPTPTTCAQAVATLNADEAYRNGYARTLLSVSHRWEDPSQPDVAGAQMREVRQYLLEHEEIEGVWYDFWSMPQDERTADERKDGRVGEPIVWSEEGKKQDEQQDGEEEEAAGGASKRARVS